MFKSGLIHRSTFVLLLLLFTSVTALGQSSIFSYQGRLTDNGNPADGLYEFQFRLFTTATVGTGTQVGTTISQTLQVTNGAFSVQLDFDACPACFDGAARFLEISIRPVGSQDPHTVLGPRQPITSAPYAVRSLTAVTADNASQLGGQPATGFIQNTASQQAGTNFNISGSGTAGGTLTGGVVNATTQYNINGMRILAASGPFDDGATIIAASNTFLGENAGLSTTPNATLNHPNGKFNSFFGANAGKDHTSGHHNAFFGTDAGKNFFSGHNNSFFGASTGGTTGGQFATAGSNNTLIGAFAQVSPEFVVTSNATAIGAHALVSRNNSLVLGSIDGVNGAISSVNVGIGVTAPRTRLDVVSNEAQIRFGDTNTDSGGYLVSTTDSQAILSGGAKWDGSAWVAQTNSASMVENSGGGILFSGDTGLISLSTFTPTVRMVIQGDGNVGIGTTAPSASLHVSRSTSSISTPVAILESAGDQTPLAFRSGPTEVARVRADSLGNLVLATLSGASKNIFFRAGDDSGTDMLIQSSTGNVGIGDTTPVDKLDVEGDIRVGTGTTGCVKDANASVIAGTCSSDARLKHSVTAFPETLDKLIKLRPVHFYWRADEYKDRAFGAAQSFGLIAQEVERVLPELVTQDEQGLKAVRYNKLPLLMLQAVKELKTEKDEEIAALKVENDELKRQLKRQEERLRRLEAAMIKVGGKN
jgi:hypothetical protein